MDGSTSSKRGIPSSSTERGGQGTGPIARLVAERGATKPRADLLELAHRSTTPPADGPPSLEILDEMKEERL